MIDYVVNNAPLLIAALAVLVVAITSVSNFFQKPTEEQIKSFREWLLYCVCYCEKQLGSGTGKLKLRYAYDLFLDKFPTLSRFITFEAFSGYVDSALDQMKELISTNMKIKEYIGQM